MRWKRLTTLGLYAGLALVPVVSWGQQVHFDSCNATTTAGLLLVSGQVAGLGNQMRPPTPLQMEAIVTAVCVDPTTTPPTVGGSASASDGRTYPPKNGNREYAFVVQAPVVLPCDPPQLIALGLRVCDTTHEVCCTPLLPVVVEPE